MKATLAIALLLVVTPAPADPMPANQVRFDLGIVYAGVEYMRRVGPLGVGPVALYWTLGGPELGASMRLNVGEDVGWRYTPAISILTSPTADRALWAFLVPLDVEHRSRPAGLAVHFGLGWPVGIAGEYEPKLQLSCCASDAPRTRRASGLFSVHILFGLAWGF